jgi:hypothetical protein
VLGEWKEPSEEYLFEDFRYNRQEAMNDRRSHPVWRRVRIPPP